MRITDLAAYGAPQALLDVWAGHLGDLTLIQERAVVAGALDGRTNLLVVAPTSSGKTLVGEIAATSAAYRTRRHALFLVPFRALADEHYATFRERYGHLLSVVIATSDWTEADEDIKSGNFGLAVLTYEKLAGMLVDSPQLLDRCSVVVIDEVQMLGDRGRGAGLEALLTQIIVHSNSPQLIALSASLDSLNQLDSWLRATLVMANERPVPLEEGVLAPGSGRLLLSTYESRDFAAQAEDAEGALLNAVSELVREGKQVLVFRSSIEKTRNTAEALKLRLHAPGLPPLTAALLDELEWTENTEALRRTLASRVGYHNADLTTGERAAVERSFRSGEATVIVATTTLAMGVNLPCDAVVIGDHKRWYPERGSWRFEDLSVADYKNAAGRAGRLGLKLGGLAILVAEDDSEQRQLVDFYSRGEVEPVRSQLPSVPFDDVVFNAVCSRLADDEPSLVDLLTSTFAYLTFYEMHGGVAAIEAGVAKALAACEASGLLSRAGTKVAPTPAAIAFARRSIPLSAAVKLSGLAATLALGTVPRVEILWRVASNDELFDKRPYVAWDKARNRPVDPKTTLSAGKRFAESPTTSEAWASTPFGEVDARVLLRAACLSEWTDGEDASVLAGRYKGCPGSRLRGMGQTAAWLLDGLQQVASGLGASSEVVEDVRTLATEARYGVPADLAPLVSLDVQGVGRTSLLKLYKGDQGRNLFDPDTLLDADLAEFDGLLRPAEVDKLRSAIVSSRGESLRRRREGQTARADSAAFSKRLIDDLYVTDGLALEQAVTDALLAVGVPVTRVIVQKNAEEDLQITHPRGTIVVSVTASADDARRITWAKAREVLSTGVGITPINYVCVGRPGFHTLAERQSRQMAKEVPPRRLLLVPVDVLAEMIVRCREGLLSSEALVELLGTEMGVLTIVDLASAGAQTASTTVKTH